MKFIFSHIHRATLTYKTSASLAALSNYHLQNQGYETILFADEYSLKELSKVNFTHREPLRPHETNHFPQWLWSLGKLVALKKIKEPCIHIDLDLLYKKINPLDIEKGILCLHKEQYQKKAHLLMQEVFRIRPKETEGIDIMSYNCGLIGAKDYETLHDAIDILFNFIEDNHSDIITITEYYKKAMLSTLLVEQVWLLQIVKYLGKNVSTICEFPEWNTQGIETLAKYGIVHYQGPDKQHNEEKIIKEANRLKLSY